MPGLIVEPSRLHEEPVERTATGTQGFFDRMAAVEALGSLSHGGILRRGGKGAVREGELKKDSSAKSRGDRSNKRIGWPSRATPGLFRYASGASKTLIPRPPGGYAGRLMNRHGSYKLTYRSPPPEASYMDPLGRGIGRAQRIVDSLRCQILDGGPEQALRIRQIFSTPREIFRVEIVEDALNYSRTTLLDRDALEDLLETEGVRERVLEGSDT